MSSRNPVGRDTDPNSILLADAHHLLRIPFPKTRNTMTFLSSKVSKTVDNKVRNAVFSTTSSVYLFPTPDTRKTFLLPSRPSPPTLSTPRTNRMRKTLFRTIRMAYRPVLPISKTKDAASSLMDRRRVSTTIKTTYMSMCAITLLSSNHSTEPIFPFL